MSLFDRNYSHWLFFFLPQERNLSTEEVNQVEELLCNGYWAFECLTVRDYNDMICGVCGIAPKVEIAQRNAESVLSLKNIEVDRECIVLKLHLFVSVDVHILFKHLHLSTIEFTKVGFYFSKIDGLVFY